MSESYRHCGDVSLTLDGRSLLPHLNGQSGHEEVIGECLDWEHQPMVAASEQSMRNSIKNE